MSKRGRKDDQDDKENDDITERYFLNPEAVSHHLYCSICQDVFHDPQRAPCGHSYCKTCIFSWLKQSCSCPEDRKPLQKHQLHHDFILENIIGDQMVACPHRRRGCDFVGQLQTLAAHKKCCDFNPHNVPAFLQEPSEKASHGQGVLEDSLLSTAEGKLPTPAKPSLKMRLFRAGGGQKDMLCSMFADRKESPS